MFLDRVIYFGGNLRDQVKGRSPKKLKSLIQVPYVPHVKVQILSFNMILMSSPWLVTKPSYGFRGKFGRSGKRSFTEKAKRDNLCSLCSAPESIGFELVTGCQKPDQACHMHSARAPSTGQIFRYVCRISYYYEI